jgi:hypothetical protein
MVIGRLGNAQLAPKSIAFALPGCEARHGGFHCFALIFLGYVARCDALHCNG